MIRKRIIINANILDDIYLIYKNHNKKFSIRINKSFQNCCNNHFNKIKTSIKNHKLKATWWTFTWQTILNSKITIFPFI